MSAVVSRFLEEILEKNTKTQKHKKHKTNIFLTLKKGKGSFFLRPTYNLPLKKKLKTGAYQVFPVNMGGKYLTNLFFWYRYV
jgi:hypothetical protein